MPYATPGADITPIIDAPPTPITYVAPGGRFLALVHHESHPPIAMLARPYLPLAGTRVDQRLGARRRMRRLTGLSVVRTGDGTEIPVSLPAEAQVGPPIWAPDGRRFAFSVDGADGVGLWIADASSGEAGPVPELTVRDVLGGDTSATGGTVRWSRDGRSLLVLAAPDAPLMLPESPIEPQTDETAGKHSQMATYTDLLATPADEDAFEALATTVPCRVDPLTGARQELGPPGLYQSLNDSPDGTHLLVHRLQRPFSFRVPWSLFARRVEVWDASGTPVTVIADLPVSDEVPRQGVPTGPRLVSWEERAPASLVWTEALDGGDPVAPAEHRDRIMRLGAPFTGEPGAVLDVRHRCLGWYDLDEANRLLLTEHDRDRRWLTTWLLDLAEPDRRRVIFDLSADDAYSDPGAPLVVLHPDGSRTVLADGSAIYLRGDGATPDGDRPFFDRFDLATLTATRLHESPPGAIEHVLGFTDAGDAEVVLWHESPTEPPNLLAATLDGSRSRPLTAWPDPHPQLTPIARQLITHDRGDGVTLSGILHLPPGHDPGRDGRLPLLIWAYPFDFGGASTAGQVRGSTSEFTRLTALGPVAFVLRGYAVLADATMPVIGDPE
ncbi:MAG TPA: hypothetical protein VKD66_01435, partial [Streptosporangiaceae bacterium]|nr:hypothetical protein [Streptosporangiaceae bacterium]